MVYATHGDEWAMVYYCYTNIISYHIIDNYIGIINIIGMMDIIDIILVCGWENLFVAPKGSFYREYE